MTVPSNVVRSQYSGNGATTAFTFNGKLLDQSHVKVVTLDTTDPDADPAGVTKVITTHYTVSGVGGSSATVTFLVAPATGTRVTLSYNVPLTQAVDYLANDPFPAETHEGALDKLTLLVQQQQDALSRAILFPVTSLVALVPTLPPIPVDNAAIVWDGATGAMKNGAILTDLQDAIDACDADAVTTAANAATTTSNAASCATNATAAAASAALAQAAVGGVRVSVTDTTAATLMTKLVAGANITLTRNNAGANETFTITSAGTTQEVLLGTYTASGSAALGMTSAISSAYSKYRLVFKDLLPSTSASICIRVSTNNGTTWAGTLVAQVAAVTEGGSTAPSYSGGTYAGTVAPINTAGTPAVSGWADFECSAEFLFKSLLRSAGVSGCQEAFASASAVINAVQILPSTGILTSGTVYLYGLKNT